MYLSDHSKNLISAEEKVAELIKQRDQLRAELAAARQRETIAIASWDEERNRALREGERVVEWRDRAESAEAELAKERARSKTLAEAGLECASHVSVMALPDDGDDSPYDRFIAARATLDAATKADAK